MSKKDDRLESRLLAFEAYKTLLIELQTLTSYILEQDQALPAYTSILPVPHHQKTSPQIIPCENIFNHAARQKTSEILLTTTFLPEQKVQASVRCPGLIAASSKTLEQVQKVNQCKQDLQEKIQHIDHRRTVRQREIAKVIPYFSFRQTIRSIPYTSIPPSKVMFSWAANSAGNKRVTVNEVLQRLAEEEQHIPPSDDQDFIDNWHTMLAMERKHLSQYSGQEIMAYRTVLKPYPIANIYTPQQQKIMASLPLFYPVGKLRELPPLRPLETMDLHFSRAKRSDRKLQDEAIIPRIHLYRYHKKYREYQQ